MEAEPIWIEPDVAELIDSARHTFEPEPVQASDPFCPMGFALLGSPIPMHDLPWTPEEPGRSIDGITPLRAIAWMSIHSEDRSQGVFWISLYNHIDDDAGHHEGWTEEEKALVRRTSPLLLSHAFQWTWGTAPSPERLSVTAVEGEDPDEAYMRAREQSATVQVLWRLAQTFAPVKERAPRGLRRDAQRKLNRRSWMT